jgi:hypothetical protein
LRFAARALTLLPWCALCSNVQPNEQQGSSGFQCTFAKILKKKSDSGGVLVGVEIVKQTFVFQGLVYSLDDVFGQGRWDYLLFVFRAIAGWFICGICCLATHLRETL